MSTPTPTPRVDAEMRYFPGNGHPITVDINFARQLETELAASQARELQLQEALKLCHGIAGDKSIELDPDHDCKKAFGEIIEAASDGLLLPPPPVVPLAVAQQLAEACQHIISPFRPHWDETKRLCVAALAAFAPYKP